MDKITYKRGSGRALKLATTIGGVAPDLTGATFSFVVKRRLTDTTYEIEIVDANFDKSEISDGIVYAPISTVHTDIEPGIYVSELKITITSLTDVPISKTWDFEIQTSVH